VGHGYKGTRKFIVSKAIYPPPGSNGRDDKGRAYIDYNFRDFNKASEFAKSSEYGENGIIKRNLGMIGFTCRVYRK